MIAYFTIEQIQIFIVGSVDDERIFKYLELCGLVSHLKNSNHTIYKLVFEVYFVRIMACVCVYQSNLLSRTGGLDENVDWNW